MSVVNACGVEWVLFQWRRVAAVPLWCRKLYQVLLAAARREVVRRAMMKS